MKSSQLWRVGIMAPRQGGPFIILCWSLITFEYLANCWTVARLVERQLLVIGLDNVDRWTGYILHLGQQCSRPIFWSISRATFSHLTNCYSLVGDIVLVASSWSSWSSWRGSSSRSCCSSWSSSSSTSAPTDVHSA